MPSIGGGVIGRGCLLRPPNTGAAKGKPPRQEERVWEKIFAASGRGASADWLLRDASRKPPRSSCDHWGGMSQGSHSTRALSRKQCRRCPNHGGTHSPAEKKGQTYKETRAPHIADSLIPHPHNSNNPLLDVAVSEAFWNHPISLPACRYSAAAIG